MPAANVRPERTLGSVGGATLPAFERLHVRVGAVHVELQTRGPAIRPEGEIKKETK